MTHREAGADDRGALRVVELERAPIQRCDAKDAEEVRMDQPDADELGAAGHLHAHLAAVVVGERIEHSGVSADVDLVAAREIRNCAI